MDPLGNITKIVPPTTKFDNIPAAVAGVIDFLFLFVGGLAAIAIIYSGIMYMTAGGDAEKANKAKQNLLWAIIGLVVALLAVVIISWIKPLLSGTP